MVGERLYWRYISLFSNRRQCSDITAAYCLSGAKMSLSEVRYVLLSLLHLMNEEQKKRKRGFVLFPFIWLYTMYLESHNNMDAVFYPHHSKIITILKASDKNYIIIMFFLLKWKDFGVNALYLYYLKDVWVV